MARKRLRDWPQKVFKYAVTSATIPQQMWTQARRMQSLWNALAIEHEYVRMSIRDSTPEEERQERWELFNREALCLSKQFDLNWEADVLDNFQKACTAAAKNPGRGWPRCRSLTVSIPHRFTGGGAEINLLSSQRAKRIRFDESLSYERRPEFSQDRRSISGVFGLDNNEQIAFTATVHRPIPADAIVKQVRWMGLRSTAFGWEWWICITVELPHPPDRVPTGKRCAIDVGWRKRGDFLRVGYLYASDGEHRELLLPLDCSTRSSRRQKNRIAPQSYRELRQLASERGLALQSLKDTLKPLLSPPPPGFDKMRERGIIGLRGSLPEDSEARQRIGEWLEWDTPRFRAETAARAHFARRRADLYSKMAAEIASRFDEVIVENLDIKSMIEESDKDIGLQMSDRYHQIAATAQLIQCLERACKSTGSVLTKKSALDSTGTCCVCGGIIECGPSLVLTCENGHSLDQDENAARNLFSQTWGGLTRKGELREKRKTSLVKRASANRLTE